MKKIKVLAVVAFVGLSMAVGAGVVVKLTASSASSTPALTTPERRVAGEASTFAEISAAVEEQPAPTVEEEPAPTVQEEPAPTVQGGPAPIVEAAPAPRAIEAPQAPAERPLAPQPSPTPAPRINVPEMTNPVAPINKVTDGLPNGYEDRPVLDMGPYNPDKAWTCQPDPSGNGRICW
jgi:hypothetical protein